MRSCIVAFLLSLVAVAAADLKIATADLQVVLERYDKAQETARELEQRKVSFLEELKDLKLEVQKLASQAGDLRDRATAPVFSADEREKSKLAFENKVVELKQIEVRYDDLRARREAELQVYTTRVQRKIMDDIALATRSVGKREGVHLILNSNKSNLFASDVLFTEGVTDLTAKILEVLNAPKSTDEPPPAIKDQG